MAKKKSASRADAVRDAVDQAFKAQIPRDTISGVLDEIGNTAGRLRGAVDELRPASEADVKALRSEVKKLRADLAAIRTRIDSLEANPGPAPRRARSATGAGSAKPAAAKRTPAKPAAAKRAAGTKRTAGAKSSAAKPRAAKRARKPPAAG